MYHIKTESSFDSAHFLRDHTGKCSNIHGHRWIVSVEVRSEHLESYGSAKGMVVDFATLKSDLRNETERLDHTLIIEKGSLMDATVQVLEAEGFTLISLDFRPTAENLSRYFWDKLIEKGYPLYCVQVEETPENCAFFTGGNNG